MLSWRLFSSGYASFLTMLDTPSISTLNSTP